MKTLRFFIPYALLIMIVAGACSAASLTVTISTAPSLPTTLYPGNTLSISALATGGSGTYSSYKFIAFNSTTGAEVYVVAASSNTVIYKLPAGYSTLVFNVLVTDTGSNTVNSINTAVLTDSGLHISQYSNTWLPFAVAVIGQTGFNGDGGSDPTPNGLSYPTDTSFDQYGDLWVADAGDNRILEYLPANQVTNGYASTVIGQTNLNSGSSATTQNGLSYPPGISFDKSGDLWVADYYNNRVLEYLPANEVTNGYASIVIGQPNFNSGNSATTQNGLNNPYGVSSDQSGNLWVADYGNNRVLEYVPANQLTNGYASLAIGQPNFGSFSDATTQNALSGPYRTSFDQYGNLWVADFSNNRALGYYPSNQVTNGDASIVIGQPNFNSANAAIAAQNSLSLPSSTSFDQYGDLWVADLGNNRVLGYSPANQVTGGYASIVIGQPNFNSKGTATTQNSVYGPESVSFDQYGNLWITDYFDSRVLEYVRTSSGLVSSTQNTQQGVSETLTASVAGGLAPYSYTYLVTNITNGNVIESYSDSSALPSDAFTFMIPSTSNAIGTLDVQVMVQDSTGQLVTAANEINVSENTTTTTITTTVQQCVVCGSGGTGAGPAPTTVATTTTANTTTSTSTSTTSSTTTANTTTVPTTVAQQQQQGQGGQGSGGSAAGGSEGQSGQNSSIGIPNSTSQAQRSAAEIAQQKAYQQTTDKNSAEGATLVTVTVVVGVSSRRGGGKGGGRH